MSSVNGQSDKALDPLASELHPPLTRHEAKVESDRCYFCFDAPCVTACPTGIDIPLFIRQIHAGNVSGAARTIFDENIFGGMCARVCPTETLCEDACVRNLGEEKPVQIGLLQRHATDLLMATGKQPYVRAPGSGKRVIVVGAGPAGLSCAHRLAMYGHSVTVLDANAKSGGLNEYGIAAYKTVDNFAQRELEYILSIGGIEINTSQQLGVDVTVAELKQQYDAVFLGIGLAAVNSLGIKGEEGKGVVDAVEFISELRQAHTSGVPEVGRQVVVIGGGMTAIDAAVQSKLLGAEDVMIAYRRGFEHMNASRFEQELAKIKGVALKPWLQPTHIQTDGKGVVTGIELEYTHLVGDRLEGTGRRVTVPADRVLKAIGQKFDHTPIADAALKSDAGRLVVDANRRTSDSQIWAGGDCIAGGEDLTVAAVQDGKLAAESINSLL